jgi:hypothetical protein
MHHNAGIQYVAPLESFPARKAGRYPEQEEVKLFSETFPKEQPPF